MMSSSASSVDPNIQQQSADVLTELSVNDEAVFKVSDSREYVGHKDEVNSCAFSVDGQILVTGSDDGRVRIFNAATQQLLCYLRGHQGPVKNCAISRDSRYFASCSTDTTIIVWRTRTCDKIHHLTGHSRSVECVSFSPDGGLLASTSWDHTVILWDMKDGTVMWRCRKQPSAVQCCAFSLDGAILATGSWDNSVSVYSISNICDCDYEPRLLWGHSANVYCITFSAAAIMASGAWDGTIRIYKPRTWHVLAVLDVAGSWIRSLAFSADSLMLASTSDDCIVRVWDVVSGQCCSQLESEADLLSNCIFVAYGPLLAGGAGEMLYKLPANVFVGQ